MRFLWPLAFILSVALWAQGDFSTPFEMADAPGPHQREEAFHRNLSRYKLSDPAMQAGVIRLFNRETDDPQWEELDEELWHEDYYYELWDLCKRIATEYHNKHAWHALIYSNYNEDSPDGLWLAAQLEAFPLLLELAHDPNSQYAGRGTVLVAEALARCYAPGATRCSVVLANKQQISALVRGRISSKNDELKAGALVAIAICGTRVDVAFLSEKYDSLDHEPVASPRAADDKKSTLWLLKRAIKMIQDRESQSAVRLN